MPEAEPDALVAAVLHQQPLHKLLRAGADPAVRDQAGLTPLHHAVLAGNADAVEALLDHACKRTRPLRKPGGEPSRAPGSPWVLATAPGPTPSRPSPLHLAAERSDSLLKLILGHSSLTSVAVSFLGITISSRPQAELLHLRDARGWSLLHYAVSRPNLSTMRQLLPHMGAAASELGSGGSSRSSSAGGMPPSHTGNTAPGSSCGVNVPDAQGRTALHQAAHLGHAEACRLLLKADADQSLASSPPEGALPLHLAAAGNHTAAIEVLFRHAVNKHGFRATQMMLLRPNAAGMTALHVAVQHGAVDAARRLLHLVFPFDTRGPLGRTALHLASLLGDTPMISMLLGHSTPQQRQLHDAEGFTAIHLAAATGRLEALRVLAAGGCGVDSRAEAALHAPAGCEGWTPLHCAVRRGDVGTIDLLVSELGADPHAKDAGGRTAYDLAVTIAGDDSRQGSSVVGAGSGIQNLDDAQWATDATATESEGGRSGGGGGTERVASGTVIRGGSGGGAVAGLAVDPLQGPSGVLAALLHSQNGSGGYAGGSGSTRLDEAQALAVLQTFIRLLHEPMRRTGVVPPVLAGALGAASGQSVAIADSPRNQSTPVVLETSPSPPLGAPAPGTATQPSASQNSGPRTTQSPSEDGKGAASGRMQTPPAWVSGNGQHAAASTAAAPTTVQGPLAAGTAAGVLFVANTFPHVPAAGEHELSEVRPAIMGSPGGSSCRAANPAQATAMAEARAGGQAACRAKDGSAPGEQGCVAATNQNGFAHGHDAGAPPVGGLTVQEPQGGDGKEAPSVALAYAAKMLAGPAATRTRASPFSKPTASRASPFQKPAAPAAQSAASATVAPAPAVAVSAPSIPDGMAAPTPTTALATVVNTVAAAASGDAPASPGPGHAPATAAIAAEATSATASAAPGNPGAAVKTIVTKRSPFAARPSPFAAAAAARPLPVASLPAQLSPTEPESAPPQLEPRTEQQDLESQQPAEAAAAPAATAAAAAQEATPEASSVTTAAPPPADAATATAAPAGSTPTPVPQPQPQPWTTPFAVAAAMQQSSAFAAQPNGAPLSVGPPSGDPAASLCIVSSINSPCGYSALNRAILLQRHGLAEALLATLPPLGHHGGVLVLSGPPVGGGRSAAMATVAYQPFNAASMANVGLHYQPLLAAASSSDATEAATARPGPSRAATFRAGGGGNAPLPPLAPSACACTRPHTPPRQQPSHKLLHLHHQPSGSPAQSDVPLSLGVDASSRAAPPLLPLRCPSGAARSFTSGPLPQPGSALIPGVLSWDDATEIFRTQPPNHTSRAWLHWPGEPDPSTAWLVAELVVVEAGAAGGHVWLGLGPTPGALSPSASSSSGSGSLTAGPSATALTTPGTTPASGLPGAAAPGGPSPPGMARSATAAAPLGRGAAGGGGGAHGGGAPGPINVAGCPVINHPSTHVACLRDGQAFRGGVLSLDMTTGASRLEARNGDTVALFWNRRGRSVAYTLNGRYCGRLSGLPVHAHLTPIVGTQCSGFVFKWRCYSRVANGGGGGGSGLPPEPYTCPSCTSNIDGMLIREQMLHEDPETPWLCKPSMTSLHFAAWSGNVRVLPYLVRAKGFSPDDVDVDGWTPLHFAALAGHDEAVRLLLSLNCHPDRKSKYGSTPAMLAAKYGRSSEHVAIVRLLSDVGAVLDLRDPRGRTLLMLAARAGNLAMVQLLLERGLDPSATDALDREAQQYAGQHAAIFRLLRNAQAAQRAGARKGKRKLQQEQEQQQQQAAAVTAAAAAAAAAAAPAKAEGIAEGDEDGDDEDEDDSDGDGVDGAGVGRGRELDVQHLPLLADRWRVGAGQLVRGRLIEQGAFGAVFEGTWCGARVAIKQVMRRRRARGSRGGDGDGDGDGEEDPEAAREAAALEREVAILAALPPHERIARMLGSVKLPGEGVCLVMAYYPHTLQAVMQSERLRRSWLTPTRRACIARQLAEGLAFLHGLPGPRVIHRDLKPNNVLLEAAPALGVKICDFGLSRILAGNDVQSSSAAGHAFWMAPELLRALSYDETVDVYSFGVILYQLAYWVDDQLYGGLNKAQVDFQVVHGILRLQDRLPGGIEPAVQALVRDCVDENSRNRPSMAQVLERLSNVRELPQPGHGGGGVGGATAATAAAGGPVEVGLRQTPGGAEPELHRQG